MQVELYWLALLASCIALAVAAGAAALVLAKPKGSGRMVEIYEAIKQGAKAYMNRQYKTLMAFIILLAVIFAVTVDYFTAGRSGSPYFPYTGLSFLVGALFSALAGYLGMSVAVECNVRTANAAKSGLREALSTSFKGGLVMGLCMVGLALLGVALFYWLWRNPLLFAGFGFGGSLVALFARIGGGIYTKSADVGADLVGKIEAGIPEDDPRNPAVIADAVGDNVGDCAGMAADVFETYAVTLIGAMLLGWPLYTKFNNLAFLEYPLILGAIAIFSTIIGALTVRAKEGGDPTSAILRGIVVTAVLAIIGFSLATWQLFGHLELFYSALIGVVIVVLLAVLTDYYTSYRHSPTRSIAEAAQAGPAINIIRGLANGLESAFLPTLVIALGVIGAYLLAGGLSNPYMGMYGVAIAAMAMLSIAGIIVSVDAYGPIVDNAGGIAEMAGLDPKVREIADTLDAVGNTTKALTKTFAIGSAGLAALSLLLAYMNEVASYKGMADITKLTSELSLASPKVIFGLLLGGGLVFLFASFCMKGVARGAFGIVNEVRRQFKEIPGIMEGKAKPDYAKCVDIVTRTGLRGMALPGALVVLSPIIVGFVFGPYALAGLLIGCIVAGLALALMMAKGGAAWDNAKKFIETGAFGGKRSPAHAAAVVGDTVGDPCKDTAGPAINPMIKAINMISIIFAGLIVALTLIP
jgi:K(+)-stimulated pyrophosphate-energized sodium pump